MAVGVQLQLRGRAHRGGAVRVAGHEVGQLRERARIELAAPQSGGEPGEGARVGVARACRRGVHQRGAVAPVERGGRAREPASLVPDGPGRVRVRPRLDRVPPRPQAIRRERRRPAVVAPSDEREHGLGAGGVHHVHPAGDLLVAVGEHHDLDGGRVADDALRRVAAAVDGGLDPVDDDGTRCGASGRRRAGIGGSPGARDAAAPGRRRTRPDRGVSAGDGGHRGATDWRGRRATGAEYPAQRSVMLRPRERRVTS